MALASFRRFPIEVAACFYGKTAPALVATGTIRFRRKPVSQKYKVSDVH